MSSQFRREEEQLTSNLNAIEQKFRGLKDINSLSLFDLPELMLKLLLLMEKKEQKKFTHTK